MMFLLNRYELRCLKAHSTYAVLLITAVQLEHSRPFLRRVLVLPLIHCVFVAGKTLFLALARPHRGVALRWEAFIAAPLAERGGLGSGYCANSHWLASGEIWS
ncbi:hypothetical protein [Pseudomonas sp.]|uniref:hypothetical protein n=1 Tax=Pseudomonas sp. TaxID=306 RepID=UPI002734EA18|nr:hypothetical protein [Pseudomonas sp.]MDP3816053.1 hypothetical protein [Pseudomonas sp.]